MYREQNGLFLVSINIARFIHLLAVIPGVVVLYQCLQLREYISNDTPSMVEHSRVTFFYVNIVIHQEVLSNIT